MTVNPDDDLVGGLQGGSNSASVAAEELRSFVERIERLLEEKKGIGDDIKEVKAELKGRGFDVKATMQLIKERTQDASERQEREAILDLYRQALGMD